MTKNVISIYPWSNQGLRVPLWIGDDTIQMEGLQSELCLKMIVEQNVAGICVV